MYETIGISFDSMILDLEFMDLRNVFILIPLKESPSKTPSKKALSGYTLPFTIQKIPRKNRKSSHTNFHPKVIPHASSPCRAPHALHAHAPRPRCAAAEVKNVAVCCQESASDALNIEDLAEMLGGVQRGQISQG